MYVYVCIESLMMWTRIGQFLRQRPASASELRPLSGLDPTTHASVSDLYFPAQLYCRFVSFKLTIFFNPWTFIIQLALKDAEQFMNLQNNSAMAYVLKANALILVRPHPLFMFHVSLIHSIHVAHINNIGWQLEKFELARDVIRRGVQIDGSRYLLLQYFSYWWFIHIKLSSRSFNTSNY